MADLQEAEEDLSIVRSFAEKGPLPVVRNEIRKIISNKLRHVERIGENSCSFCSRTNPRLGP